MQGGADLATTESLRFGPFLLRPGARVLELDGQRVPLGGRAFDILTTLIERAGEVVSQKDLYERVWPGLNVNEASLRVQIRALRVALGAGDGDVTYVSNIPARGYCFVAPVSGGPPAPPPAEAPPPPIAPQTNLPRPVDAFVGRQSEIADLDERFFTQRLITLVGPGGNGKSRLAVELGWRLCERFPDGVSLLGQTLQYDPNSIEALHLLISYDLYQKQPDKLLARLKTQIARTPTNSGFYDLLAQLQIQNKNLDEAAVTAQKAIELNSDDGEAVMLFARIQVQRGQVANAIGAWEQWRNAHPNDAGALALLGILEESRGNLAVAESYYKKCLQMRPQQPIAANNLAYRMLQNGENVDVALTLAQTARQGMPNSTSAADTLAWAYYYKGTYGFARDLLKLGKCPPCYKRSCYRFFRTAVSRVLAAGPALRSMYA